MENVAEKQVIESINKAHRILVVIPQNPNGDTLGAGLGLLHFFKKLEKEAELVTSANDVSSFSFLPGIGLLKRQLSSPQGFVISVSSKNASLDELSYEQQADRIDIFLKPKTGQFTPQDVSFRSGNFAYDLLFTAGAPSLDHLGEVYEKNTDLFFEVPVINIDHHANNEYFGEINLVDLAATSTSEIVSLLIENFEQGLIDESIATSLLTGIITETNSFQHAKTTPRAFLKASNLIAAGGRHQDIIRELYKTKSIPLLKLWGRALARLTEVPEYGLTYSLLNNQDLAKTESGPIEIYGVMKELIANLSGRKIVLLLAETEPARVTGYFYLHPSVKPEIVTAAFNGKMLNGFLGSFSVENKALLEVEKEVLEKLGRLKEPIAV